MKSLFLFFATEPNIAAVLRFAKQGLGATWWEMSEWLWGPETWTGAGGGAGRGKQRC